MYLYVSNSGGKARRNLNSEDNAQAISSMVELNCASEQTRLKNQNLIRDNEMIWKNVLQMQETYWADKLAKAGLL